MASIRRSLLTGSILGSLAIVVGAAFAVDRVVRSSIFAESDRALEAEARLLSSILELTEEGLELEFDVLDLSRFEEPEGPAYLRIDLPGHRVLYESRSWVAADLDELLPDERDGTGDVDEAGRHLRWIAMTFPLREDVTSADEEPDPIDENPPVADEPPDEAAGPEFVALTDAERDAARAALTLTLAHDATRADTVLATIRGWLGVLGLTAGVVGVALLWVVVGRSLRPLRKLSRDIADRDESSLSRTISVDGAPDELVPVIAELNRLLLRIEAAFLRERTFSSDIAHELRTPLAGLRTTLEVTLAADRDGASYREALDTSLDIVSRLQEMVQALLYLARLESGDVEVERQPVDLVSLVDVTWDGLAPVATERRLRIDRVMPDEAPLHTDPALLATALRNVLENAVLHANEGGRVRVEVRNGAEPTSIRVSNTGSRVSSAEVETLFERFTRGDASRSRGAGHVGLGLALVKKIATTLELDVEATAEVDGEFTVTLRDGVRG